MALGLPLLNPYLDKNASFSNGVNFAVAGSTALDFTFFTTRGIVIPVITAPLSVQVNWFKQYLASICCSPTANYPAWSNAYSSSQQFSNRMEFPNVVIISADYYGAFRSLLIRAPLLGFNTSSLLKACCGIGGPYSYDSNRACGTAGVPGPDGHFASLFPSHSVLDKKEVWVTLITESPKPPPERITFTLPVINSASNVAMVVTSGSKAEAVHLVIDDAKPDRPSLPAKLVQLTKGNLVWFLDKTAASKLGKTKISEQGLACTCLVFM
ncbi:hypothetical protein ACH5RR_003792 [Cinchona calisaya]|uniref:Glucosamine/galactosamine-6-phosphate isomerase domain-containing protein n=1 Tax=Cinchona calisaya TaxID=153742 RepID=A0ABD3AVU7_9GENT